MLNVEILFTSWMYLRVLTAVFDTYCFLHFVHFSTFSVMKYQNTCFQFAFWMKIWVLRLNIHFLHEVQFLLTSISTCGNCSSIWTPINKHICMVFHTFCYMYLFKLPNMPWVKMCQSFIILFSTVMHIYIYLSIYWLWIVIF